MCELYVLKEINNCDHHPQQKENPHHVSRQSNHHPRDDAVQLRRCVQLASGANRQGIRYGPAG